MLHYRIPVESFEALQMELERYSKKGEKLGTGKLAINILNQDIVDQADGSVRVFYNVEVIGQTPKIDGWTFVAKLDHNTDTTGASNLVYAMPGQNVPEHLRNSPAHCEHCGHRRYRRLTYLLQNEAGNWKQVGHTCIQDFIGHDPSKLLKAAEYYLLLCEAAEKAANSTYHFTPTNQRTLKLEVYLAAVATAIRLHGWVSGAKARNDERLVSTREQAQHILDYSSDITTDDDRNIAFAAIEWAKQQDKAKDNFYHNMVTIAEQGFIDYKSRGVAAAIVAMYKHTLPKPQPVPSTSNHLGQKGDKLDLNVEITKSEVRFGDYGAYILVQMRTEPGDVVFTYATGSFSPKVGDKLHIRCKVKSHNEFKGTKQTQVHYVKVV
jgi:hypothetical protein